MSRFIENSIFWGFYRCQIPPTSRARSWKLSTTTAAAKIIANPTRGQGRIVSLLPHGAGVGSLLSPQSLILCAKLNAFYFKGDRFPDF